MGRHLCPEGVAQLGHLMFTIADKSGPLVLSGWDDTVDRVEIKCSVCDTHYMLFEVRAKQKNC